MLLNFIDPTSGTAFVNEIEIPIEMGEQIDMMLKLRNIGTRDLVDIRMVIDVYTDWKYAVDPEVVASLKRTEEAEIQLVLMPSADVGVGE